MKENIVRENSEQSTEICDFKSLSLQYSSSFTPENVSEFTELGQKLYELASFDRMKEAIEVSKINIIDGKGDFTIRLKAKEGFKIFSVDNARLCGRSDSTTSARERERQAKVFFGFSGENEKMPYYVFTSSEEEIPEKIERGLRQKNSILLSRSPYEGPMTHYQVIKELPIVKEAIKKEFEAADPRFFTYSFGKVDVSAQQDWEKTNYSYHYDSWATIINPCKDFKLFNISDYSKSLEDGEYEISTSDCTFEKDTNKIKETYEALEETVDQFESPINREIQEKRIDYYKKVYSYIKKQEDEIGEMKRNPGYLDKYFADATIENPMEIPKNYENFLKLNLLLKGDKVAVYHTGSFHEYYESLKKIGNYSDSEIKRGRVDVGDIISNLEDINSGVSLAADSFAISEIIGAVKKAGFEVEDVGRSGFQSRNSYEFILPKVTVNAHILKSGSYINNQEIGGNRDGFWYCGQALVEVNDQNKRQEVLQIIEKVKQEEINKKDQEFVDEFKSRGDGVTGLMKIGGKEKYKKVPGRFKVLTEVRVANTQDHRQNLSHTYDYLLIDTEAIKGKKMIEIEVPNELKGLVIGKGGQNIKRISQELGLFIKIK